MKRTTFSFGLRRSFAVVFCLVCLPEIVPSLAAGAGMDSMDTVNLPPLVITESLDLPPWKYVRLGGLEILSRSPWETTKYFGGEMYQLHQWLSLLIPPEDPSKPAVPLSIVLYGTESQEMLYKGVAKELEQKSIDAARLGKAPLNSKLVPLPNLRLSDKDLEVNFFILSDTYFTRDRLSLSADYVSTLLTRHTPSLPRWFIVGAKKLYLDSDFSVSPIVLGPMVWIDEAETKRAVKAGKEYLPDLLQMGRLFENSQPGLNDQNAKWSSQAELFLRWVLDSKDPTRLEQLRGFLKAASSEPPTEATFKGYFGLNYADVQDRMGFYLRHALTKNTLVKTPYFTPPEVKVELADKVQIARIKGDWERMEIAYVRKYYPALVSQYVMQARQTLLHAYQAPADDPEMLAVAGLLECDLGEDRKAVGFLQIAAAHKIIRPRVYLELARIKLSEALGGGDSLKPLRADQAAELLGLLEIGRNQSPVLPEIYFLVGEILNRSELKPTEAQIRVLSEGIRLFPQYYRLYGQLAALYIRTGDMPDAVRYADLGAKNATDDSAALRQFGLLQSRLKNINNTR